MIGTALKCRRPGTYMFESEREWRSQAFREDESSEWLWIRKAGALTPVRRARLFTLGGAAYQCYVSFFAISFERQ